MRVRSWFALIGLATFLVMAEGIARLYGDRVCTDAPGAFFQADPRVGWTHVPGLRGIVGRCDGAPIPAVPAEAGPTGLLDPVRPFRKPPGTRRVLLVGGNGPEGLGVVPEMRMARLLEDLLRADVGGPVEVVNAATGGWALDNALAWLRAEGLRYGPDLVVVVVDPGSELASLSPPLIAAAGQHVPRKPFLVLRDGRLETAPAPPGRPPAPPREPRGLAAWSQLVRTLTGQPTHTGPPLAWADDVDRPTTEVLDAELGRVGFLAEAILGAMRDEAAAAGARVLVVLAPRVGGAPEGGDPNRTRLADIAARAQLPVVDLDGPFEAAERARREPFFPETPRWSGGGHAIAAAAVALAVRSQGLLPVQPGVPFRQGEALVLRELPAAVAGRIARARWNVVGRFLAAALLAVPLAWVAGVFPAAVRAWLLAALGLAVVWAATDGPIALGALALVSAAYGAVELPWRFRWVRWVALPAVLAALALLPAVVGPGGSAGERLEARIVLALGSGMLLLRVAGHVRTRQQGGSRVAFAEYLAAVLFFPTLLLGPLSVPADGAGRDLAPQAPDTLAELEARLLDALRGLGVLVLGLLLLVLAPAVSSANLAVHLTGGATLPPGRVWLWLLEQWALATVFFAGFGSLGAGLARMLGARTPRGFDAPWRAADARDFWRRWMASFHEALARAWYRPLAAGRWGPDVAVVATFALVAAYWARTALVLLGLGASELVAVRGFAGWAALWALAVLAARRLPPLERRSALSRAASVVATAFVGAFAWAAFFLPPAVPLRRLGSIALRLVGLP